MEVYLVGNNICPITTKEIEKCHNGFLFKINMNVQGIEQLSRISSANDCGNVYFENGFDANQVLQNARNVELP